MNQALQQLPSVPLLARRLGAFSVTFIAGLFACPFLAFAIHPVVPRVVANFLFFWPQLAVFPFGFTFPAGDMTRTYLGGGWNCPIAVFFWLLVGIAVSWLLRKKAVRVTAFVTLPISFAIGIAAAAVLEQFDVGIYFEGP